MVNTDTVIIINNLESKEIISKNIIQHIFNAPDEDKSSYFCRCGAYLTDNIHKRYIQ